MRLIFIAAARLYPPADRTLWFTGSVHSDDSQFFATPELTRTCRKELPRQSQLIGGAHLFLAY
jgi:hypothetical protein